MTNCSPASPYLHLPERPPPSFRTVRTGHIDIAIVISTRHTDAPWIAADLAVLNEAAVDIRLYIDLHLLAAKGARHHELVWHLVILFLLIELTCDSLR
jgi:hypothetical protein